MNSKKQAIITIRNLRKVVKGRCPNCLERRTFLAVDTQADGQWRFEVWAVCSCQTLKFKGDK